MPTIDNHAQLVFAVMSIGFWHMLHVVVTQVCASKESSGAVLKTQNVHLKSVSTCNESTLGTMMYMVMYDFLFCCFPYVHN